MSFAARPSTLAASSNPASPIWRSNCRTTDQHRRLCGRSPEDLRRGRGGQISSPAITSCVRGTACPVAWTKRKIVIFGVLSLAPDQGEHGSRFGAMALSQGRSGLSAQGHVLGQGAINPFVYLGQAGFDPSTPQQHRTNPRHIGGVSQRRALAARFDREGLCRS